MWLHKKQKYWRWLREYPSTLETESCFCALIASVSLLSEKIWRRVIVPSQDNPFRGSPINLKTARFYWANLCVWQQKNDRPWRWVIYDVASYPNAKVRIRKNGESLRKCSPHTSTNDLGPKLGPNNRKTSDLNFMNWRKKFGKFLLSIRPIHTIQSKILTFWWSQVQFKWRRKLRFETTDDREKALTQSSTDAETVADRWTDNRRWDAKMIDDTLTNDRR